MCPASEPIAASGSSYIRSRGMGENAVRRAFPAATMVRPAVMFGAGDAFLSTIVGLLRRLPAYPMFGRGLTQLQPAHVDDVAEAIARTLAAPAPGSSYELGGPRVYAYEMLLRTIAGQLGFRPLWCRCRSESGTASRLPRKCCPVRPVTRNQIELMQVDTIVAPGSPGFEALGIDPQSIEQALAAMLRDG